MERQLSSNKTRNRLLLIGGALICFAFIAFEISTNDTLGFDTDIREWVYLHRTPLLNKMLISITYVGNWQTIVALGIVLIIIPATRKNIGIPMAITSVCSTILYKISKTLFQRPRPDVSLHLIEQGGYSFPSGHSMNCLVCYGILIFLIRRYCNNKIVANILTVVLTLLIILIGFSRVYVGVHFPTDILGGWSFGIVVLTVAIMILEHIKGSTENGLQ